MSSSADLQICDSSYLTRQHCYVCWSNMDVKIIQDFVEQNPVVVRNFKKVVDKETAVTETVMNGTSEDLRKQANDLYRRKKFTEARLLYTESIRTADYDSVSESLAYSNRSAVSFELTNYLDCLMDINNALTNSLTPMKLLLRKASCLIRLQRIDEAVTVLDEINFSMNDLDENNPPRQHDVETYGCLKKELSSLDKAPHDEKSAEQTESELYKAPHLSLLSASSVLTVHYSQSKGRYIKKIGSCFRHLSPVSRRVQSSQSDMYNSLLIKLFTHETLDRGEKLCRKRICKVVYCSRDCETESWFKFHQYECSCLTILTDTGIGHLAYRIVTQTGYHILISHRDTHLNTSSTAGLVDTDVDEYSSVYNLVTHVDDVLPEDKREYVKMTILLLLCALNSNFFTDLPSADLSDERVLYIGSLLLRHILQLICNAHAITLVRVDRHTHSAVMEADQVKLATAIYPTASLLNHSCKPNISVSFVNSELMVKSSVDLKTGDEVYNCYGPHYLKMDRKERKEALRSQYYFDCDCEACLDDSTSDQSSVKSLCCPLCNGAAILSSETTASCSVCLKTYNSTPQLNSIMSAKEVMYKAENACDSSKGLKLARHAYQLLKTAVYKYNLDLASAKDLEAKYHAELGDMISCADCLTESVTILEHIYKPDSVELGHEYLKLSEVLINTGQCYRALHYAVKSRAIFTKHYSYNHSQTREVEALIDQLKLLQV